MSFELYTRTSLFLKNHVAQGPTVCGGSEVTETADSAVSVDSAVPG